MIECARRVSSGLLLLCACCVALRQGAHGQTVPAATTLQTGNQTGIQTGSQAGTKLTSGFPIPTLNGSLHVSLTGSESFISGYNGRNQSSNSSNISGSANYASASARNPFNLSLAAGYLANGNNQPSSSFETLSLAQGVTLGRWTLNLSDALHYTPTTPVTGLSGIPGVGDLGSLPVGNEPQGVLTQNSSRIDNLVSGTVARSLTGSTSAHLSGSYRVQRFLGSANNGIESDSTSGGAGLNHRIDARTSVSSDYTYNGTTYLGTNQSFSSQGISFGYNRQMTRKLAVALSAGPQRLSNTSAAPTSAQAQAQAEAHAVPATGPSISYTAGAHLTYIASLSHPSAISLAFDRNTSSGSGVTLGATVTNVSFVGSRGLTRTLQVSGQTGYSHTATLSVLTQVPFTSDAVVFSGQVSQSFLRVMSIYASYTGQRQLSQGVSAGVAPLNGLTQTVAFGLTYTPAAIHLGRR